jgi:hypothetical protein
MAKLYIFGIGGTGSRVIKSLTLMLASGVKLPGAFNTIVPIIIDPDTANGDLNRTTDILTKYQEVRNTIKDGKNFFNTKIETLKELINPDSPTTQNNFKFSIDGTSNETFRDFIDYYSLSDTNKALIDLLYTEKDLKLDMDVGFKGNPNIGSVVLNQFKKSKEYIDFANSFAQGDAIFIISSIFGGTGASGFPLLLKNLRSSDVNIPNGNLIENSKIGAISYLPYYKIGMPNGDTERTIDSSLFFGKAKSALSYYEHSIFQNKSLDAFYYIGDDSSKVLEHNDGKALQKNPAHFLELAGALAIINFMKSIDGIDRINNPLFSEFGIEQVSGSLEFGNLGSRTKDDIAVPLSKFMLFNNFLTYVKDEALNSKDTWHEATKSKKGSNQNDRYNKDFFSEDFFFMKLEPFLKYYSEWFEEMAGNDIPFNPFRTQTSYDELINFINGYEVNNSLLSKKASAKRLIEKLNKIIDHSKYESKEERFIKLFDKATEEVISGIIK